MSRKPMPASKIMDHVRDIEARTNVAAWVIMRDGEHIGTVRILYPRDGAGRLRACLADWTAPTPEDCDFQNWTRWQYGWANGFGYDKESAALSGMTIAGLTLQDSGHSWRGQMYHAGFDVIQAV